MLTSREFVAVTLHSNQCKLGPTSLQIRILKIFFLTDLIGFLLVTS